MTWSILRTPSFLKQLTVATVLVPALALPAFVTAQPTQLKELAAERGIHVGAAVTFPGGMNAANRPEYERVLRDNFTGMVAENAMKFQVLTNNTRGTYNWNGANAIMDFAEDNDMVLRGHALVWHSQAANWFNNLEGDATSRDTTLRIMREHIDSVMSHFRGRIYEWDVVNEAIAQNGGPSPNYRSTSNNSSYVSQWFNRVGGPDYIDSAFVYTQRADTAALLYYNDFGGEFMTQQKSQNVYDLVSGLKERGIPIHGIGLQCHFNVGSIDTAALTENMRRLADLGLVVSLTEIDIQFASNNSPPTAAQLQTQKNNYKAVMSACLSVPACKNFYVWGVNDNQSWRTPRENRAPLLFTGTSTLTAKPAWDGVVEALQEATNLPTSAPTAPWNVVARPTVNGMVVSWNAPVADGRSPITGYKAMVDSDTTQFCTTDGARVCTIDGLSLDSTYRFIVRAGNAVGFGGMSPPSHPTVWHPVSISQGASPYRFGVDGFSRNYTFRLPDSEVPTTRRLVMTIVDITGRTVWQHTLRPSESRTGEITWNGMTRQGQPASPGMYIVRVRSVTDGRTLEIVRGGTTL